MSFGPGGITGASGSGLTAVEVEELGRLARRLWKDGPRLWLRGELLALEDPGQQPVGGVTAARESVAELFVLEALVLDDRAVFVLRRGVGRTTVVVAGRGVREVRATDERELLELYERFAAGKQGGGGEEPAADQLPRPAVTDEHAGPVEGPLSLDFLGLYDAESFVDSVDRVGRGLEAQVRRTVSHLRGRGEARERLLLTLLGAPSRRGRRVLIDPAQLAAPGCLSEALRLARSELARMRPDASGTECLETLRGLGLEPGWGDSPARIAETLALVQNLLEDPTEDTLNSLLDRLPLAERVVIVSPHGWFGQEKVLGRPDTGGQIVYILDQVRGLEAALQSRLKAAGVQAAPRIVVLTRQIPRSEGTSCGEAREPVLGTRKGMILRLPFRDEEDRVVPQWMSRFRVWPYLHGFADRAAVELTREMGGPPDLVIGNYSDGNLVATLLAGRFGCPLATIAHALEKTKYALADLRWGEYEAQYHFSVQLLADLVAMNAADFVITSTFQEIAGDERSRGQYEAHRSFTLPGLYRVQGGTDPFLDKFTIIPPGVNEEVFFPHSELSRRDPARQEALEELLFTASGEEIFGTLEQPGRTPLLTLARLDRTKNITGLVESFGASAALRDRCNLLVVAGRTDAARATDPEERAEIEHMYELIARHRLEGRIRWLGVHLPKQDTGELYRIVADRRGLFVQPALYEAFGLTVLEAMASGLPTFATRHGGPAEIIEDRVNGYLIDPRAVGGITAPLAGFLEAMDADAEAWDRVSRAGVQRVGERFSWGRYSRQVLDAAALYGLRREDRGRAERRRIDAYNHLLLRLLLMPRARAMAFQTPPS